jgi:hypothetical protein
MKWIRWESNDNEWIDDEYDIIMKINDDELDKWIDNRYKWW